MLQLISDHAKHLDGFRYGRAIPLYVDFTLEKVFNCEADVCFSVVLNIWVSMVKLVSFAPDTLFLSF